MVNANCLNKAVWPKNLHLTLYDLLGSVIYLLHVLNPLKIRIGQLLNLCNLKKHDDSEYKSQEMFDECIPVQPGKINKI